MPVEKGCSSGRQAKSMLTAALMAVVFGILEGWCGKSIGCSYSRLSPPSTRNINQVHKLEVVPALGILGKEFSWFVEHIPRYYHERIR